MLTDRQKRLLQIIVESYVSDVEPVSSGFLVDKLDESVSSATVRNEMASLEDAGYIHQPHTSSGRIPTEKAYQYYIESFLDKKKRMNRSMEEDVLRIKAKEKDSRTRLKAVAKELADHSKQAVFVLFDERESYYTGLSNLFSQPEFEEQDLVVDISETIDKLDKLVQKFFVMRPDTPEILIGRRNPINSSCSVIIRACRGREGDGLIAILGPMRMDYQQNYTLIDETLKLLE